jgi:hypothetical protein
MNLKLHAMKKILLILLMFSGFATQVHSQCSTTSAPTNNCTFSDLISAFSLNGIPSTGNSGCSTSGYSFFPTPVRTLMLGNTYTWSATCGGVYPDALAIWIDLNNDGFYTSSEQMAVSPAALTHSGSITVPFTATPATNVRMRVRSAWNASTISNTAACTNGIGSGYGETEDYLVDIVTPPQCSGTPPASTVLSVAPPTVCSGGGINLSVPGSYTLWGYAFQWQSATSSSVGPYTAITNATTTAFTPTNITTATWYQLAISCVYSSQTIQATPLQVTVEALTTSSVPYSEGFEGIYANNILPNCSWKASNTPSITQTYTLSASNNRLPHTGNKFASFRYSTNVAGDYFYTNGIQLKTGVTYSAGAWYIVDGLPGFSNFSLLYGPNQSTTGLTPIASITGTVAGQFYQLLSNTFTVASSGIYYMAIKAIGNANAYYLSFDDLFIQIPCGQAPNSPSVALSTSSTSICEGDLVNLSVTGASTFTWSTGSNLTAIAETPTSTTTYYVTGTNALTNCSNTQTQTIIVNPRPSVSVFAPTQTVCSGQGASLFAFGAASYTWSNSSTGNIIMVTPAATTVYSVTGVSSAGCSAEAIQEIFVNAIPTLTAGSDHSLSCVGEKVVLSVNGAVTYQWISDTSPLVYQGGTVAIYPTVTTIYTITGTDNHGCVNKTTFMQDVSDCLGINGSTWALENLKVYPNPTSGLLTIETGAGLNKVIQVIDLTGRILVSEQNSDQMGNIDLSGLSKGIYYLKIRLGESIRTIKLIKQ